MCEKHIVYVLNKMCFYTVKSDGKRQEHVLSSNRLCGVQLNKY